MKCPTCSGCRFVIFYKECKTYACGTARYAKYCPDCGGRGEIAAEGSDQLKAAAGDK